MCPSRKKKNDIKDNVEVKVVNEKEKASRKSEIDDLWAELNKEEPIPIKRQKIENEATKPSDIKEASITKKEEELKKDKSLEDEALAIIRAMKSGNTKKIKETINFAGRVYENERGMTVKDEKKIIQREKNQLKGTLSGLDNLVNMIDDGKKNITAISKSKIDWNKYAKDEKIESKLEQNRKDGYLQKKGFIEKTNEKVSQKKKEVERLAKSS